MALNFANNNSLSAITTKPSGLSGGTMNLISTQTASGSANISFTSGIDSTYDEYVFKFYNIHPASNTVNLQINASTDGGSNYNVTKTTSYFLAYHTENDSGTALQYYANRDLAQSTSAQQIVTIGNTNDDSASGTLTLYNPSSSVFVKHFISRLQAPTGEATQNCKDTYVAGYFNTTSAINAVQFTMSSGNIDSGVIKLYGVS
jgi:hypothetical protein